MTFPEFNENGDLPPEVYSASLREVINHFGEIAPQRQIVAMRLERIHEVAVGTGHLKHFVIFGSFVTAKCDPNDIDIFMIMDDEFDVSKVDPSSAVLFDHAVAQSHFGASVFWVRSIGALGGEESAIRDWMVTRQGHDRGIIELKDECHDRQRK